MIVHGEDIVAVPKGRFADWLTDPVRRNRSTYVKVALAAVFINIFGLVSSLFSMTIYDRVLPGRAFDSLTALTIGMAMVVVFDFMLKMLRSYFVDHAGAQIDRDMGQRAFSQMLSMQLDRRQGSPGQLAGTMRELETLRDFFTSATLVAMIDVPFILVTLLVIWLVGGAIVIVPLLTVPAVIIVGLLTQPALDRLAAKSLGEGLAKQSILVETLGAIETVKAAGAGPMLGRRWLGAVDRHSHSSLRQRLVGAIATTFATSAGTVSYAAVIVYGVFLVTDNKLTSGGLIACSILVGRAIAPLAQISQLLARLNATRTAYRQIDAMMSAPRDGPAGEALAVGAVRGLIEFRNVSFAYPGATEKALDNVSFSVQPGERVAMLGRVGSGKSTIARLLLGLHRPQEGHILIDGTEIGQLDPARLRAAIGSVLQEPVLLTGSVRDNILLDRDGLDDEEMLRCAEISGTHQFMSHLVNGYDRRLADRGEGLSGGQRQSIAIARALAGRPSVIVLDEPSSAMDTQTEEALIGRLASEFEGRTVLVVTHRPSLLKLVQRIIVMHQGKIAADGPRDAVLARMTGSKAA